MYVQGESPDIAKDKLYNSVAYKLNLKESLEQALEMKKAVALSGFKYIANWKDNNIQDIQLDRKTTIKSNVKAEFPFDSTPMKFASLTTVSAIMKDGYDKKIVSVKGHIFCK